MAAAATLRVLSRNRTGEAVAPYVPPEPNPNLLLWSEELQQAAWAKSNCTVTANATNDPDDVATADLVESSTVGEYVIEQTAPETPAGGGTYTFSVYIKAGPGNVGDLAVARIVDDSGSVGSDQVVPNGNWQRLVVTATLSPGATFVKPGVVAPTGEESDLYLAWAKLEEGSQATAYVKREGV